MFPHGTGRRRIMHKDREYVVLESRKARARAECWGRREWAALSYMIVWMPEITSKQCTVQEYARPP
jgi:hypothetical protein